MTKKTDKKYMLVLVIDVVLIGQKNTWHFPVSYMLNCWWQKKTDKKYMLVLVNADVVLTYMAETLRVKLY